MPQPTRFSYASTSNALPSTIRDHLKRITKNAEVNNARGEMAGVLVYGNNFFFHCLEHPHPPSTRFIEMLFSIHWMSNSNY